jgi:hypothetical protein
MMLDLIIAGLFSPLMSQIVASLNRMWFGFLNHVGFSVVYGGLAWLLVFKGRAAGLAAAAPLAQIVCLVPSFYYILTCERKLVSSLPMREMILGLGCSVFLAWAAGSWLPQPVAIGVAVVLIPLGLAVQVKLAKNGLGSQGL